MYHSGELMNQADLVCAADLVDMTGGRRWTRGQADEQLGKALHHLPLAALQATSTAELDALAHLVTRRDF